MEKKKDLVTEQLDSSLILILVLKEQTKPDKNKHLDTEHRVLVTREEGGAGVGE